MGSSTRLVPTVLLNHMKILVGFVLRQEDYRSFSSPGIRDQGKPAASYRAQLEAVSALLPDGPFRGALRIICLHGAQSSAPGEWA